MISQKDAGRPVGPIQAKALFGVFTHTAVHKRRPRCAAGDHACIHPQARRRKGFKCLYGCKRGVDAFFYRPLILRNRANLGLRCPQG